MKSEERDHLQMEGSGNTLRLLFLRFYLFIFREREREGGKRRRETSTCGCLSCTPTEDLVCNPGVFPGWELNQQPFGSQAGTQSTEPHQPGQFVAI